MNCISTPPLDEQQLVRFVDGEASDAVVAHIAQCTYCRKRAETLARLQKRLRRQLYRLVCPSPMQLGDYHLGYLNPEHARQIQDHLAGCPHCRAEIGKLAKSLSEWASQPDILHPIRRLIAQLVGGGTATQEPRVPPLLPAFGGLRGEDEEPLIYQADGVQIVIGVQDDAEQPGLKILLGLVTGSKPNAFSVQASQEGQVISVTSIDEIGNFIIPHLVPGQYDLTFTSSDVEIQIPRLSI